ncbi:hypothetical protein EPI10_024670 [Gossypium australe]|uniref:Reverse transcriptase Ty1/copia-type domain-containing protein n=1 Tax=Gossypium australe TaxID=47621 RepID=A0A5B6VZN1_9ROSI|nr:hypothetical protein EPI10_024670 [Gossypium australe]
MAAPSVVANNSFLNGDLADEVFMQQPPGYVQCGSNGKPLVCRLKKALYGLRQVPRAWFDKLKCFLLSIGFVISKSDASLFVRITTNSTLYVLVYVDDIIITGSMPNCINSFVQQLNDEFSLKDMGDLYYFLRIEVTRSFTGCLHFCQRKYIRDLLDRSSMSHAKSVHTPMVSSSTLSKDDRDRLRDPTEYRSLVGALQYVVLTNPDIAYAGAGFDDHRSTTGYCVYFGHTPVSWCSKKYAVAVATNPVSHSKFKHVELDLFFVREKVADGSVLLVRFLLYYRYHIKGLMLTLVEVSGRVVKVDYNTTDEKRGKFARIVVVVDLSKPLILFLRIDWKKQEPASAGRNGGRPTSQIKGTPTIQRFTVLKWIVSLSRKLNEHTSQMINPNGGSLNGLLSSTSSGANEEIEQPMIVVEDMEAENDVEVNNSPGSNL